MLLVYLPSLDFIVAFLACIRVGLVPVPVYPPDPRRSKAYVTAFAQIARDCDAKFAVSHTDYLRLTSLSALADVARAIFTLGLTKSAPRDWPDLTWLNSTELLASTSAASLAAAAPAAPALAGAPAFLQYTSGSTADPKGVIITHGSLQHNLTTIMRSLGVNTTSTCVSWLPQYLDMGLIGACAQEGARPPFSRDAKQDRRGVPAHTFPFTRRTPPCYAHLP